jgi:hypothetical protein
VKKVMFRRKKPEKRKMMTVIVYMRMLKRKLENQ